MLSFKQVVLCLKYAVYLIVQRSFESTIPDIVQQNAGATTTQLPKFERPTIKRLKTQLDVQFLIICRSFNIYPNVFCLFFKKRNSIWRQIMKTFSFLKN